VGTRSKDYAHSYTGPSAEGKHQATWSLPARKLSGLCRTTFHRLNGDASVMVSVEPDEWDQRDRLIDLLVSQALDDVEEGRLDTEAALRMIAQLTWYAAWNLRSETLMWG
jgi:hypothetical protein